MALPKAKEDALAARLAALPAMAGKGWLAASRNAALARLRAIRPCAVETDAQRAWAGAGR